MLSREPRFVALVLLSLAAGSAVPAQSIESKGSPAGPPSAAAKADDAGPTPAPGRMFVVGRVLDPRGNPVPGAAVMVQAKDETPGRAPFISRGKLIPLGDARADGSGRFRIDAPGRPRHDTTDFSAVAMAPGYGVGWVTLDPDDDRPAADIRSGRSR